MNQHESITPKRSEQVFPTGETWLIDDAKRIDQQALEETVESLRENGVYAVIIVTDNPQNDETAELLFSNISKAGYVEVTADGKEPTSHDNFPTDVFACIIDYRTRTIICRTGEDLYSVLSTKDIKKAEELIAEGAKAGDPTKGFRDALQYVQQQVVENVPDPAETYDEVIAVEPKPVVSQNPTTTPTPISMTSPKEPMLPKVREAIIDMGPGALVLSSLVALATAAFLGERKLLRPRMEVLNSLRSVIATLTELEGKLAVRDQRYLELAGLLHTSYPEKSQEIVDLSKKYIPDLEGALIKLYGLREKSGHLGIKKRSELVNLLNEYQLVVSKLSEFSEDQDKIVAQIQDLRNTLERGAVSIASANERLSEVTDWYTQQYAADMMLPVPEEGLARINEIHASITRANDSGATLLAIIDAEELLRILVPFEEAVTALMEANQLIVSRTDEIAQNSESWPPGSPTLDDVCKSANFHLQQARVDLVDDLEFADVAESTGLASHEIEQAWQFTQDYNDAMIALNEHESSISAMEASGYRMTPQVISLQQELTDDLNTVARAITSNNNWKLANQLLRELVDTSLRTKNSFQEWIALRLETEDKLKDLSLKVKKADDIRSLTVQPAWEKLQTYKSENFNGLERYFDQASTIIQQLFDNPNDETDLASQAERLNSMEDQKFDQAEVKVAEMFAQLAKAEQMMDQLTARLEQVVFAEKNVSETIDKAERAIVSAQASFAGDLDRLVLEETEEGVVLARQKLEQVRHNLSERNYFLSQEQALEALLTANQTKQSADEQVSRNKLVLAQATEGLVSTQNDAKRTIGEVESTAAVIVRPQTQDMVVSLAKNLGIARTKYEQLSQYEDDELYHQATSHNEFVGRLRADINQLDQALTNDKREYQSAIQDAVTRITMAESAISAAQRETSDHRAGSSGGHELSNAKSRLPRRPMVNESYSQLQQIISDAEQANRYAQAAKREAEQQIEAHEAAERRRKEQERREREAAERRRREEDDRRRNSYSSYSSSAFSSSSSRSSSSSHNFGGSSRGSTTGGTKF